MVPVPIHYMEINGDAFIKKKKTYTCSTKETKNKCQNLYIWWTVPLSYSLSELLLEKDKNNFKKGLKNLHAAWVREDDAYFAKTRWGQNAMTVWPPCQQFKSFCASTLFFSTTFQRKPWPAVKTVVRCIMVQSGVILNDFCIEARLTGSNQAQWLASFMDTV